MTEQTGQGEMTAINERLGSIDQRLGKIEAHLEKQNDKVFNTCMEVVALKTEVATLKLAALEKEAKEAQATGELVAVADGSPTVTETAAMIDRAVKRTWISVILGVLAGSGATAVILKLPDILKLLGL